MKKSIILISSFLVPAVILAQFGFERKYDINVIKDNIQQNHPWMGGLNSCQYSNIDLDQDGTLDLFIFEKTDKTIRTFVQEGNTGVMDFRYAPEYEAVFEDPAISLAGWVLMADYNGDGKQDIFTTGLFGLTKSI